MKQEIALRSFSELSTTSKVNEIEETMRQHPNQLQLEVRHHFSPGIYGKELFIPKGTLLTGRIHKYAIMNIMTQGEISVLIGDEIIRIKAPYVVVTPAGSKKIGYTHEDTIWMGVMATEETNPVILEDLFTAGSEQEYLEFIEQLHLENKCLSLSQSV